MPVPRKLQITYRDPLQVEAEKGVNFIEAWKNQIEIFSARSGVLAPMKLISIVLPVHNEEKNIPLIYQQLNQELSAIQGKYVFEYIFVDDGSSDDSMRELEKFALQDPSVKVLSFSRNFGHQMAITAGYDHAKGDAVICMDSDLQHPPRVIPRLIEKWESGSDVVYTMRRESKSASFFKRYTTSIFYSLINKISHTKINKNAADFRLLSRHALQAFLKIRERDRFVRGLVGWIGFKSDVVEYEANDRIHGKTKYSAYKMLRFAMDAITSFSGMPLRFSFFVGMFIAITSFLYGLYLIIQYVFFDAQYVAGWPSILVSVLFLGGIQLVSVGILGEYIYRIFNETKGRPLYIIDKSFNTNI
jgi:dolichol-phosphate mannosyltransferase